MEFTMQMKVSKESLPVGSWNGNGTATATLAPSLDPPHRITKQTYSLQVRMQSHLTPRGVRLLYDSNGADLEAAKLAVMALAAVPHAYDRHSWALLGDLDDPGLGPEQEHRELGEFCAEHYIDRVVGIGEFAAAIAAGAIDHGLSEENVHAFPDAPSALSYLREYVGKGDVILVKGAQATNPEGILAAMCSI